MYYPRLSILPTSLRRANTYIKDNHRHHGALNSCRFALRVLDGRGKQRGVLVTRNPASKSLDDQLTLEISRICTDGAKNAVTKLVGSTRRAAKALGYKRIITYTLPEEGGASLRAANFDLVDTACGDTKLRHGGNGQRRQTGHLWRWELAL